MFNINNRYRQQKKNVNALYDCTSTFWKRNQYIEKKKLYLRNDFVINHHTSQMSDFTKHASETSSSE